MKRPSVSLIIAACDGGKSLQASIGSCLAQTYPGVEILLVDYGSGDATREIADAGGADPRVRVVSSPSARGRAGAWNAGLAITCGGLVQLLDESDYIMPYKTEYCRKFLLRNPSVGIVYGDFIRWTKEEGMSRLVVTPDFAPKPRVYRALFSLNPVPLGAACVRREVFDAIGSLDEDFPAAAALDLWCRAVRFFPAARMGMPFFMERESRGNESAHDMNGVLLKHLWSMSPEELFADVWNTAKMVGMEMIAKAYDRLASEMMSKNESCVEAAVEVLKAAVNLHPSEERNKWIGRLQKMLKGSPLKITPKEKSSIRKRIGAYPRAEDPSWNDYRWWIHLIEPSDGGRTQTEPGREPRVSLILPVTDAPEPFLREAVDSVRSQTYGNWQLCLALGNGAAPSVRGMIEKSAREDSRILLCFPDGTTGAAGIANAALALATGELIGFMDADGILSPAALSEIVLAAAENSGSDFYYSDEDVLSSDGTGRTDPDFKPDWSPDLLRSRNYIGHLFAADAELVANVGGFHEGFDGSEGYDLVLRLTETARGIVHIPKVLHHRRQPSDLPAGGREAERSLKDHSSRKAILDHMARLGFSGSVENGLFPGSYNARFDRLEAPTVSIIIPTRDNVDLLRQCVESITALSTYPNYEIILIENGSTHPKTFHYYREIESDPRIKVLTWDKRFNWSSVNNYGAARAAGEFFLFLNNDTQVIARTWIEEMLMHAQREPVACVGAKLYFPDRTIQHGGVVIGMGRIRGCPPWVGAASHAYFCQPDRHTWYNVVRNVSAVTGACLMVRKSVFLDLGGFDEEFEIGLNDIDFCLKAISGGYVNVFTPYAVLYHHERKTRGTEDTQAKRNLFLREVRMFIGRYKRMLDGGDPYWSRNLTTYSFVPGVEIGAEFVKERRVAI